MTLLSRVEYILNITNMRFSKKPQKGYFDFELEEPMKITTDQILRLLLLNKHIYQQISLVFSKGDSLGRVYNLRLLNTFLCPVRDNNQVEIANLILEKRLEYAFDEVIRFSFNDDKELAEFINSKSITNYNLMSIRFTLH